MENYSKPSVKVIRAMGGRLMEVSGADVGGTGGSFDAKPQSIDTGNKGVWDNN